jgi:hypothetical protein
MNRLVARACLLAMACGAAHADPGYYVVTVYDNPGVRTLDFRYWTFRPSGGPTFYWPEVGFGWNVTGRWYSELLVSYIGGGGYPTTLSTWNWQNDVLLTQGQYPFDLAIHTLYTRPKDASNGATFEIGPALQTELWRTQFNFNVFFDHGLGAQSANPTEMKYQWQVRQHWLPQLNVGAQGFGELGPWDHWLPADQQSHRAGPAIFGHANVGSGDLGWQAAWLFGKVYGRQGDMFTMRVKYEF